LIATAASARAASRAPDLAVSPAPERSLQDEAVSEPETGHGRRAGHPRS
jgi:hypothetical protein